MSKEVYDLANIISLHFFIKVEVNSIKKAAQTKWEKRQILGYAK
jgi:hypothetical protein